MPQETVHHSPGGDSLRRRLFPEDDDEPQVHAPNWGQDTPRAPQQLVPVDPPTFDPGLEPVEEESAQFAGNVPVADGDDDDDLMDSDYEPPDINPEPVPVQYQSPETSGVQALFVKAGCRKQVLMINHHTHS